MPNPMQVSRRTLTLSISFLLLVVLVCAVAFMSVPYVTMRPGPVFNTLGTLGDEPMLTFGDDVRTYPTEGRLDFTTVSVTRSESKMSLVGAIQGWLDPDIEVLPHDFVYPNGQTNEESEAAGAAMLASSQDASKAAGLRAAGFKVTEVPVVAGVQDESPADGKLEKGDVIVTVDGKQVDDQAEVADAIGTREPGEKVEIGFVRDGQDRSVTLTTKLLGDETKKARVGIAVGQGFDFPVEVENHIGDRVGGPSAGMMFALAIYDQLTPGPLTGGQNVAGTGTISPEGTVGPIGGINQKIAGAADNGADIFLVPAANCEEAKAGDDHDMTLVKVAKLTEAIDALDVLATNPKAKVPSC